MTDDNQRGNPVTRDEMIDHAAQGCLLDVATSVHEWIETRRHDNAFAVTRMKEAQATIRDHMARLLDSVDSAR